MSDKDKLSEIDDKYPLTHEEATKDYRVRHIVGIRGGSSKRRYNCNVCGVEVDSDSAKYPVTKHALNAIDAHAAAHEAKLSRSGA